MLEQLVCASDKFSASLGLISSVSGGSLGSACYIYRQAQGPAARDAGKAAMRSSLDEVAWGLAWPDFIKSLFPWGMKKVLGRGRALEEAWCLSCATPEHPQSLLDQPLSRWNSGVRDGLLPAVIMNATIVESGQRLLFGTTRFAERVNCRARVNAAMLHGEDCDVSAVTAARLSSSFPYVTPASRSTLDGPRPHVVDGGYYDNYGMSTLVEWMDEGLVSDQISQEPVVKSALVIQIHGSPVAKSNEVARGNVRDRGWLFQILAPFLALYSVREAGQIAHNDLELQQLQEKWFYRQVPIHTVTLEFPNEDAPLSWHMTVQQQKAIHLQWEKSAEVKQAKDQIVDFLNGSDSLNCPCPTCRSRPQPLPAAKAATP